MHPKWSSLVLLWSFCGPPLVVLLHVCDMAAHHAESHSPVGSVGSVAFGSGPSSPLSPQFGSGPASRRPHLHNRRPALSAQTLARAPTVLTEVVHCMRELHHCWAAPRQDWLLWRRLLTSPSTWTGRAEHPPVDHGRARVYVHSKGVHVHCIFSCGPPWSSVVLLGPPCVCVC
jgi:hypothetical protein